jgi:peptidylprolyl isomerase
MKIYSLLIASALVLSACNGGGSSDESAATEETTVKTLDSGVKVEILEAGDGVLPQQGQKVSVHYKGMLLDSSEFDNSFKRGEPITFKIGVGQVIPGWDQGIAQLSKGARAILTIPADQAYGAMERPGIPANSTLVFEVEMVDIQEAPAPIAHEPYNTEGIEPIVTPSGLKIYMVEEGTGAQAAAGKNVEVHYYGMLEDGTKFDNSFERGEPITFMLGQGRVIPGWEEGIAMLSEGAKAQLVIPSDLAYGDRGAGGVIPPGATLIFDVDLLSVK